MTVSVRSTGTAAPAALEERLGHRFVRPALLEEALTHRSSVERRGPRPRHGNERMEFLGDRVLALVVAELLQERFPDESEGALAKRHALLVSEGVLAEIARGLGRGAVIHLSAQARGDGTAESPTVLADACEAVIGALYRDGGLAASGQFIHRFWGPRLDEGAGPPRDPKTTLQEWAQKRGLPLPAYREVGRDGPPHAPTFVISVAVQGKPVVEGRGKTKREAERAAAAGLLALLGV